MTVTGRFLVIAVLFPPALGLLFGWSAPLLIAADIGLIALGTIDYFLNKPADSLECRRTFNPRLSLDAEADINLIIRNKSGRTLQVSLREIVSPALGLQTFKTTMTIAPGAESETAYTLRPDRRGEHMLGPLSARTDGPMGFTTRQAVLASPEKVRVYPNTIDLARYNLALRRGLATEIGLHSSSWLGLGTEFESVREYIPGDEWRRINWQATSRRAKPFTNQYTDDRCQTVIVAIDAGRLMYDSGNDRKFDSVVRAALMLSYVALSRDDRVGLLIFDDSLQTFIPPGKGRGQLGLFMDDLYSLKGKLCEPDYRRMMAPLISYKRRSLVVLFTDVVETVSDSLLSSVYELRRRHLVLSLFVGNNAATTVAKAVPHTSAAVFQQATAVQLLSDRERALARMKQAGAMAQDILPEKLTMSLIDKYTEIKKRALL